MAMRSFLLVSRNPRNRFSNTRMYKRKRILRNPNLRRQTRQDTMWVCFLQSLESDCAERSEFVEMGTNEPMICLLLILSLTLEAFSNAYTHTCREGQGLFFLLIFYFLEE